jgi:hypothetical protein
MFLPELPEVPPGVSIKVQLELRYQLFRVRVAYLKEDHRGMYSALDSIAALGFPQIKQTIVDTLKLRLFRQLALESMPWADERTQLHTMN